MHLFRSNQTPYHDPEKECVVLEMDRIEDEESRVKKDEEGDLAVYLRRGRRPTQPIRRRLPLLSGLRANHQKQQCHEPQQTERQAGFRQEHRCPHVHHRIPVLDRSR
jgi:hypothetical protein